MKKLILFLTLTILSVVSYSQGLTKARAKVIGHSQRFPSSSQWDSLMDSFLFGANFPLSIVNGGLNSSLTATNGTVLRGNGTAWIPSGWTVPNTFSQGDLIYGSATNVLSALTKNTSSTRYLSNTGSSNSPAWAQVDLSNGITGTLPVANGGSNNTSFTAYSVLCAGTTSTGSFQNVSGIGSSGQVLTSNGAGTLPTWQSLFSSGGWLTNLNALTGLEHTPNEAFGSSNNFDVLFKENNIEVMRIRDGRLLINNATPGGLVSIGDQGSGALPTLLTFPNATWGKSINYVYQDDAGTFSISYGGNPFQQYIDGFGLRVFGLGTGWAMSVNGFDDVSTSTCFQASGHTAVGGKVLIDNTANMIIGSDEGSGADGKLEVIGTGSTSATYNLVVKNSVNQYGLAVTGDNRVFGKALHNNVGDVTGTTLQYIASGTYTPTITDSANTSARTAFKSQWIRTGNVVTVSGVADVDPTTTLTVTIIKIQLPIPSNFTAKGDCRGAASAEAIAGQSASLLETTAYASDFVLMKWSATDVTNQPMSYTFTYEIK